jgi:IS605 OrfB family transposase
VNKDAIDQHKWMTKVPQAIRDGAILDLLKAIKSSIALHKATKKVFKIKFKSCKMPTDSIAINGRDWKNGVLYPMMWSKHRLKSVETIPSKLSYDCRLQRTHLNEYYLCIPIHSPLISKTSGVDESIIALDPGVRTFMTGFDSDNNTLEWGMSDMRRIAKLHQHADKLQALVVKSKGRPKRRKSKAFKRIYRKISNLIDDCHKKLSSALCKNYSVIMIPEFQTSRMSSKFNSKLGKKIRRLMLSWCHFKFRERLKIKAEMMGVRVIIVPEDYTSKTCSCCGLMNNVGSSKIYHCQNCNSIMDRDINAAKNILIRACCERNICAIPIGGFSS